MIEIKMGYCTDEPNKIMKSPTLSNTYTGTVKEPSSIIDPVILIEANLTDIATCNYCYIPAFRRFYFVTGMKTATSTTCTIQLHVDVLTSFQDNLMACYGYVERNEDVVSLMLSDTERPRQVNPALSTIPFTPPTEASGYTYCLITTKSVTEP